jgi:hypothetical protein
MTEYTELHSYNENGIDFEGLPMKSYEKHSTK